jgi:hypothetical protein
MSAHRKLLVALAACGALLGLGTTGCAVVKPWDRNLLARPDMAFDPDPLESSRRGHVYFAKEATPPGGKGGGGGCGCN